MPVFGSPGITTTDLRQTSSVSVGAGVPVTRSGSSTTTATSTLSSPEASRGRAGSGTSVLQFPRDVTPDKRTVMRFYDYQRSASSGPERELQATVALPIPVNVQNEFNMEINSTDLGIYKRIGDAVSRGVDFDAMADTFGGMLKDAYNDPITAASYFGALSGVGTDRSTAFFQSRLGVINNPHTTAVFNGVRLLEYSLTWRLSPRSQADADSLRAIELLIAQRMHPSRNETLSDFVLDYPDLVTVEFENTVGLPKINFAFIESYSTNYGAGGGMAFYRDGSPVDVEMSIRFKEVDILTREDIR